MLFASRTTFGASSLVVPHINTVRSVRVFTMDLASNMLRANAGIQLCRGTKSAKDNRIARTLNPKIVRQQLLPPPRPLTRQLDRCSRLCSLREFLVLSPGSHEPPSHLLAVTVATCVMISTRPDRANFMSIKFLPAYVMSASARTLTPLLTTRYPVVLLLLITTTLSGVRIAREKHAVAAPIAAKIIPLVSSTLRTPGCPGPSMYTTLASIAYAVVPYNV